MNTSNLLTRLIGIPKQFSKRLGCSPSIIYKWRNGDVPNPIDKLLELTDSFEDEARIQIVDYICRKNGGHFLNDNCNGNTQAIVNDINKKIGDLVTTIAIANADEHFDKIEIQQIDGVFYDLNKLVKGFLMEHKKKYLLEL